MFCPKCGREVSADTNFCPNCGYDRNGIRETNAGGNNNGALDALFERYDSGWIIRKIALVLSILCLVVRVVCNEVTRVYAALVYDDYYTISDSGKNIIIAACVAAVLTSIGIVAYCKAKNLSTEAKSLIFTLIGVAVGVACILVSIPAPY